MFCPVISVFRFFVLLEEDDDDEGLLSGVSSETAHSLYGAFLCLRLTASIFNRLNASELNASEHDLDVRDCRGQTSSHS